MLGSVRHPWAVCAFLVLACCLIGVATRTVPQQVDKKSGALAQLDDDLSLLDYRKLGDDEPREVEGQPVCEGHGRKKRSKPKGEEILYCSREPTTPTRPKEASRGSTPKGDALGVGALGAPTTEGDPVKARASFNTGPQELEQKMSGFNSVNASSLGSAPDVVIPAGPSNLQSLKNVNVLNRGSAPDGVVSGPSNPQSLKVNASSRGSAPDGVVSGPSNLQSLKVVAQALNEQSRSAASNKTGLDGVDTNNTEISGSNQVIALSHGSAPNVDIPGSSNLQSLKVVAQALNERGRSAAKHIKHVDWDDKLSRKTDELEEAVKSLKKQEELRVLHAELKSRSDGLLNGPGRNHTRDDGSMRRSMVPCEVFEGMWRKGRHVQGEHAVPPLSTFNAMINNVQMQEPSLAQL